MTAAAPNLRWRGEFKKSSLVDNFDKTEYGVSMHQGARKKTILYLFDAGSLLIVDKNQKCWFSLKYTDEKSVTLKCPRVVYIRALRAKNIC